MNHLPDVHFAPNYGWMNDPNGMIYHDGVYELYFQHNPKDVTWGNMTWGHARSKDLVHFEELPPVLFPDEDGTMYSGCAVINEQGLLGLPQNALIFFYTMASHPPKEGQARRPFEIRMAYSLDGGNTLIKREGAVLESLGIDNRDPKVFYHEPSKAYILVLWIAGNDIGIYRSTDLEHFTLSGRQRIDGAFECPDLFELPVENTGETKWVFWSGDGAYTVGDFDGFTFTAIQSRRRGYMTGLPYAAQSYSNLEKDPKTGVVRTVNQAWLRTKCVHQKTTGVMSLPRELSLVKGPHPFTHQEEYILQQKLPKEVREVLRPMTFSNEDFSIAVLNEDEKEVSSIHYRRADQQLAVTYEGVTDYHRLFVPTKVEGWELLYDRGIIELWSKDGSGLFIEDIPYLRGVNVHLEVK